MSPTLTVIAIFFNMRREARRTLYTLSDRHQRGIGASDYDVVAIDNGSTEPLDPAEVAAFGANFSHEMQDAGNVSPAAVINDAVERARSEFVCVLIDGARMVTPGLLANGLLATRLHAHPLVATLGWHLGHKPQNHSILEGYDQRAEDELLQGVDWRADGYRLFEISSLAGSSRSGFFETPAESNCYLMRRDDFLALGGYDTRFSSPGGGLVNLDFFERALAHEQRPLIIQLGEGSFHQFHHGVSTNVPMEEHPFETFAAEYLELRGRQYARPANVPTLYFGHMPQPAMRFCMPGGGASGS